MASTTLQPTMRSSYRRMYEAFPAATDLPAARAFTAAGVYSKVALLCGIAVVTGFVGWQVAGPGLAIGAILLAAVVSVVGVFVPRLARITAPLYAAAEGIGLGWISARYESVGHGVVPVSIVFTGAVFVAALASFRLGIVRVTPRFVTFTIMATFGMAMIFLLAALGVPIPGAADIGPKGVIFGVIGLLIAVANLYVDFKFIDMMASGEMTALRTLGWGRPMMVSAGAEWYAAQSLMISLVLVYLNVLRIVAAATGNGRRG
jgi:uncharacterized YccA/Bax inhibitor family protein